MTYPRFTLSVETDPSFLSTKNILERVTERYFDVLQKDGRPHRYLPDDALPLDVTVHLTWKLPTPDIATGGVWGYPLSVTRGWTADQVDCRQIMVAIGVANVIGRIHKRQMTQSVEQIPDRMFTDIWMGAVFTPVVKTLLIHRVSPYVFRTDAAPSIADGEHQPIVHALMDTIPNVRLSPAMVQNFRQLFCRMESRVQDARWS